MSARDDGGAAFPTLVNDPKHGQWTAWGMTLRDYFAGQALITAMNGTLWSHNGDDQIALLAYRIADAMLAARKERL